MTTADDKVIGTVELKEEWLTRLQDAKSARPAGLPEIDLIRTDLAQELKPVLVCDTNPNLHRLSMTLF
jgi:hypothetical protein